MNNQLITKELATRELERRYKPQQDDLLEYLKFYFKEEKQVPLVENWHHRVIADALMKVYKGEITRLMINIPPGTLKTEMVTKGFPTWALGKNPRMRFIATGYSSTLTQNFGAEARDYYKSATYQKVFPRTTGVKQDQDNKGLWKNKFGGQYLSTGVGGSITGNRANVFIIDDPIKPDEINSEVALSSVIRWYQNTVLSRLFDPLKDAVVIIMQRLHEGDLCGYLIAEEQRGGELWHKISLPAIAIKDDEYRKIGDPLEKNRMPLEALDAFKKSMGPSNFSAQYQQDPINEELAEFKRSYFKYYRDDQCPSNLRIYTTVDLAISKKASADETVVMTVGVAPDNTKYILEYTNAKLDLFETVEAIFQHYDKWHDGNPGVFGIETVAYQQAMVQLLKKEMMLRNKFFNIEEIRSTQDKQIKIRGLLPHYRSGAIYHRAGVCEALENQLLRFPKGQHDDIIDALAFQINLWNSPMYSQPEQVKRKGESLKQLLKKEGFTR